MEKQTENFDLQTNCGKLPMEKQTDKKLKKVGKEMDNMFKMGYDTAIKEIEMLLLELGFSEYDNNYVRKEKIVSELNKLKEKK
jgi:hypothetical protein